MKHKDDLYRGGFWSASERLAELEHKLVLMQLQINEMEAKLTSNPWTRDSFPTRWGQGASQRHRAGFQSVPLSWGRLRSGRPTPGGGGSGS